MSGRRFSSQEIELYLAEVEAGLSIGQLCVKLSISERTYYRWKERFRKRVDPAYHRKVLKENRSLRRTNVQLEEDVHNLVTLLLSLHEGSNARRSLAKKIIDQFDVSERHACELLHLHRSTKRYKKFAAE